MSLDYVEGIVCFPSHKGVVGLCSHGAASRCKFVWMGARSASMVVWVTSTVDSNVDLQLWRVLMMVAFVEHRLGLLTCLEICVSCAIVV